MFPIGGLCAHEVNRVVKKSTKAALLSGLIFPGVGHLYLNRYLSGILLLVGATAAVYFFMSSAVHAALEVAENIQNGGVSLDTESIKLAISSQSGSAERGMNAATIVLIVLWLIGIVDSYRVGRKRETAEGRIGSERILR